MFNNKNQKPFYEKYNGRSASSVFRIFFLSIAVHGLYSAMNSSHQLMNLEHYVGATIFVAVFMVICAFISEHKRMTGQSKSKN